jgi:hypothetical protein
MAYLPLSTANLPDPAIDPAQGSSPQDYFNTVLYTGNGTSQSVTGVGFQPDFVAIKVRSVASGHYDFDVLRGTQKRLGFNTTGAEITNTNSLTSFNSDGFSVGSEDSVNGSGRTIVAWNWKANGSGVSNTDGSITSTVSANTESGFSIVSYTGNGTAGATVGHGLNSAPDWVVTHRRDSTSSWRVYHSALGATKMIELHTTGAAEVNGVWNNTEPTSSVFTLSSFGDVNTNTGTYIAYCFHSVEGFSKFGSYTGNGSTDGPFVYTGFRPAFVITKRTNSTSSWHMYDTTRLDRNPNAYLLFAESSSAESTGGTNYIDTLSNGFKCRGTGDALNVSGSSYIYMAFAENPFKYSNAR